MARQKVSRSGVTPSSSVAGRRSRTRSNASRLYRSDSPKSPRTAPVMKRAYWTVSGSLKPRRCRKSFTSLAWMSIGRKSSTGGPDSRTRKNTAVSDRNTTSAVWASRETRYPRIALTPLPGEGVEELVVEDGGVERAVGAPRVAGNHAGRLPPHAAVERLRGVHQHAADAAAPGRRHDHELRDLCAVIAVRAPLEVQLHGADDAAIGIARDPEPSAALERQRYAFPVCGCFAGPER